MTPVKIYYKNDCPKWAKRWNICPRDWIKYYKKQDRGFTYKYLRFDITNFEHYDWFYYQKRWIHWDDSAQHKRFGHKIYNDRHNEGKFGAKSPCCSHYPSDLRNQIVKTHRQFKRLVREWSHYLPEGVEFIWCGRFNVDAYAKTVAIPQYHHLKSKRKGY